MNRITAADINQIIASEKPFAIFRLPGDKKLHVKSGHWKRKNISGIKNDCFFVQPFDSGKKGYALVAGEKAAKIKKQSIPKTLSQKKYNAVFSDFKKEIKSKKVSKLVLSKIKKGSKKKVDIGKSFFDLCKKYPAAAVNLFFIPETGLWMGASPELLLKSDLKKTESMSLAGTISFNEKKWTVKEDEEQKIVTRFIESAFKKHLSGVTVLKKKTIRAGNVKHLCNQFNTKKKIRWKTLTHLVDELHPTPAVNGFPKKKSFKIIQKSEPHKRELYAGFFGLVFPGKKMELYVNIRCMKLINNIPYLFTGGGITEKSDVLNEWKEAELKAKGLINSLCVGEN